MDTIDRNPMAGGKDIEQQEEPRCINNNRLIKTRDENKEAKHLNIPKNMRFLVPHSLMPAQLPSDRIGDSCYEFSTETQLGAQFNGEFLG